MNTEKNNIQWLSIDTLIPYSKNPRKNDKAVDRVAQSIQEFGFNQPIVVDKDNIIVVGHTRWKASKKLGLTEVPVLFMPDGISPSKVKAYRIADNKLNELAEWDDELLVEELKELANELEDINITGFSEDVLGKMSLQTDEQYTKKIDTPIYTPKGDKPKLKDLCDSTHTNTLLDKIKQSNLSEDIKQFLTLAAHRHTAFNYSLIAEYYAHADSELQQLMEDSALVIIDFNRAIELGYVKLSDDIAEVFQEVSNNGQE
jgi:hypothetical protein